MTVKDVIQIQVNKRKVGIIGLQTAIEEMAYEFGQKSDDEIKVELLKKLSKKNYIPDRVAEDYGKAFVREFRKHLGQPYSDETDSQMLEIKILGTGCARCDWMQQEVINALAELDLAADVEHITDIKEIVTYRVMGAPALVINGKTVCVGSVPSKDKIKKWITQSDSDSNGSN
jgi:small redox-active disulfide protein 2